MKITLQKIGKPRQNIKKSVSSKIIRKVNWIIAIINQNSNENSSKKEDIFEKNQ
jgi:hypothetical protein